MAPDRYLELQLKRNEMGRREYPIFPHDLLRAELQLRGMLGGLISQVETGLRALRLTPNGSVNITRMPGESREARAAKENAPQMIEVAGHILEGANNFYETHRDPLAFITVFDAGAAATKAIAPLLLAIYGSEMLLKHGLTQINPDEIITAAEVPDPEVGKKQLVQFGLDLITDEAEAKEMFSVDPTGKSLVAAYRKSLLVAEPNIDPREGSVTAFEIVGAQAIEDIYNASFDHTFKFLK